MLPFVHSLALILSTTSSLAKKVACLKPKIKAQLGHQILDQAWLPMSTRDYEINLSEKFTKMLNKIWRNFQSLILSALSQLQQAKKGLNEYATIVLPTTTTPQGENYMPDIARNLEGKCPDSLTKL